MPAAARSTGNGGRDGTRITEIKQIVLSDAFLRPLHNIKSRVRRMMVQSATSIEAINAWLVPVDQWDGLQASIKVLETEWDMTVANMAANIGAQLNDLCQKFPDQAAEITANALSASDFKKAASFVFGAFRLSREQVLESGGLVKELDQLSLQVADDMRKLIVDGKKHENQSGSYEASTYTFMKGLADRCKSFAFIDDSLAVLARQIQEVVAALPIGLRISGAKAELVREALAQLMVPTKVLENGLALQRQFIAVATEMAAPAVAPAVAPQVVVAPVVVPPVASAPPPTAPQPRSTAKVMTPKPPKPSVQTVQAVKPPPPRPIPPQSFNPVCI